MVEKRCLKIYVKMFEIPRHEFHQIKKDYEIACINDQNLFLTFPNAREWYKSKTGKQIIPVYKLEDDFYLTTHYYQVSNDEELSLLILSLDSNETI